MDEHIEKAVAQMVKYPANFGHHCELPLYKPGGYGNTGISINRDSEALGRSNWRVIVQNLFERFPQMDWLHRSALDFKWDDRPPFVIIESRHWAVGWVNELLVDTQNEEAVLAVLAWADSLADYPVADDMDYSQEQMMEDRDNEQTDKD